MNKRIFSLVLTTATFVGITICGILFKQDIVKLLPLYVSLAVMLLQAKANRYAFLLGSLNSLLYAFVFYLFRLYAQMAQAVLVSFPLQLLTFLNWSRRPYGKATRFRQLPAKKRLLLGAGATGIWLLSWGALSWLGSSHILLDNTLTLLGILASLLNLLAFMEGVFVQAAGCVVSLLLYGVMTKENPAQLTYFLYSLYALVRITQAIFCTLALWREQKGTTT